MSEQQKIVRRSDRIAERKTKEVKKICVELCDDEFVMWDLNCLICCETLHTCTRWCGSDYWLHVQQNHPGMGCWSRDLVDSVLVIDKLA